MLNKQDIEQIGEIVDRTVERVTEEEISPHLGVFIEHMNDQFQRVLELLDAMDGRLRALSVVAIELDKTNIRVGAAEADIRLHHRRIKKLEAESSH